MNRIEFMSQLESLLQNISSEERAEALQYYNDYFDDAGTENEQEVLKALGTPFKVAENIKRDLFAGGKGTIESDKAPAEYMEKEQRDAADFGTWNTSEKAGSTYENTRRGPDPTRVPAKKDGMSGLIILLIVIGCIILSPGILGVVFGIIGVLIGLFVTWCALIFSAGVAAISLFVVAVVLLVVGIMCIFVSPLAGVAILAAMLVCAGLGILFLLLTIAMAGIATPAMFRGIAWLWNRLFAKSKKAQMA